MGEHSPNLVTLDMTKGESDSEVRMFSFLLLSQLRNKNQRKPTGTNLPQCAKDAAHA
jgi:hypothetical protein